jgi:hypothetical protein
VAARPGKDTAHDHIPEPAMTLFPYRKETDQELLSAAAAAYADAPPARNTRSSRFARSVRQGITPSETSSRRPADSTGIPA